MNGDESCVCGHIYDEHGGDPDYPGSTACAIEDCDCLCFDLNEEED